MNTPVSHCRKVLTTRASVMHQQWGKDSDATWCVHRATYCGPCQIRAPEERACDGTMQPGSAATMNGKQNCIERRHKQRRDNAIEAHVGYRMVTLRKRIDERVLQSLQYGKGLKRCIFGTDANRGRLLLNDCFLFEWKTMALRIIILHISSVISFIVVAEQWTLILG